jgi:hypothetical protein
MGWNVKGQPASQYRPSKTRRVSGLSPIKESHWNRLRQSVKRRSQIQRNIRTKGFTTRGRFTMRQTSPPKKKTGVQAVSLWKNTPPGVYFLGGPYKKGRFTVENIKGFVPWPKKLSPKR